MAISAIFYFITFILSRFVIFSDDIMFIIQRFDYFTPTYFSNYQWSFSFLCFYFIVTIFIFILAIFYIAVIYTHTWNEIVTIT